MPQRSNSIYLISLFKIMFKQMPIKMCEHSFLSQHILRKFDLQCRLMNTHTAKYTTLFIIV